MKRWDRITMDPEKMGGIPCIRDVRIPVARIVAMLGDGMSYEEILSDYPDLEEADIKQALKFAATSLYEQEIPREKKQA